MNRNAFTLIELLVVISIIAILAARIMPAIKLVRDAATSTKCMSGTRQFSLAIQAYVGDNEGFYPASNNPDNFQWPDVVHQYLAAHDGQYVDNNNSITSGNIYYCPTYIQTSRSVTNFGYDMGYGYNISHQEENGLNFVCGWGWGPYDHFKFFNESEISRKTERILIGDWPGRWLALWSPTDAGTWLATRHRKRGNYVFFDGHAGTLDSAGVFNGFRLP